MRRIIVSLLLILGFTGAAAAYDDPKSLVEAIYQPYAAGQKHPDGLEQFYSARLKGLYAANAERQAVDQKGRALDPDAPHAKEAQTFVSIRLLPTWHVVKLNIETAARAAGIPMEQELGPDDRCLSPSDFGFHNALVDDTERVTFLDFEYAGRDDPAKLVSDFFCQPEIPVPLDYHADFIARIADGFGLGEKGRARCRMLLDAYRIKWTCIILNDLLPVGAARRAFADEGSRAARCAAQLAKAEAKLAGLNA